MYIYIYMYTYVYIYIHIRGVVLQSRRYVRCRVLIASCRALAACAPALSCRPGAPGTREWGS